MEISQFCDIVAAYMNRDPSLFTVGSIDLRMQEANNAKLYAQRKMKFELAKAVVRVSVADNTGGLLSSAVLHSDGVTPVSVRHVIGASVLNTDGETTHPAEVISMESFNEMVKREGEYLRPPRGQVPLEATVLPKLVVDGDTVYFSHISSDISTSPHTAVLRVIRWMPPYDAASVKTDFFIEECVDWMQWSVIQRLNMYLKEDERIPVSSALLTDAWKTVMTWNADMASTVDDLDLD